MRRYGFHGLSYQYITRKLRKRGSQVAREHVVIAHLGNGASRRRPDGRAWPRRWASPPRRPVMGTLRRARPGRGPLPHDRQEDQRGQNIQFFGITPASRDAGISQDMRDLQALTGRRPGKRSPISSPTRPELAGWRRRSRAWKRSSSRRASAKTRGKCARRCSTEWNGWGNPSRRRSEPR